jgi:hypothetical protein
MMCHPEYRVKVREAIDRYDKQYPKLRVVLIDRGGRVTHDTNNMVTGSRG